MGVKFNHKLTFPTSLFESSFVETSERPHRSLGEGGLRRNLARLASRAKRAEALAKADLGEGGPVSFKGNGYVNGREENLDNI